MKVIIAPNTFKNSLSTFEVAEAIKKGLQHSGMKAEYILFPIADGGEGFTNILVRQLAGRMEKVVVHDPLNRKIESSFGIIHNHTAVIEVAAASGLKWLKSQEYNPLRATTYGTGELIRKALDLGLRNFIIGLGNSATVDGGAGMLRALGVQFLDTEGNEIKEPFQLPGLVTIDSSRLDKRLANCTLTVACDVDNTLLGKDGAAAVFAPQKGADADAVALLEKGLSRLSQVVKKITGNNMSAYKHGGAAGGVGAALAAFAHARLVPGINYLLSLIGFEDVLANATLLITAEGRLDKQTLGNKGPYGVAMMAREKNIPVIALAGQIPRHLDISLFTCFNAVFPISSGPVSLEIAIEQTGADITRTASQIGALLQLKLIT